MRYTIINKDTAEVKFYGVISSWWNGALDYEQTLAAIKKEGCKNLNVRVHCYGGDVLEGIAMWTANKTSGLNITFIIDGVSASMMTVVMMGGNRVEISQLGRVMLHAPRGSGGGTSKEYFNYGKLLKGFESDFVKVYAQKSGKKEADCQKYMDGSDYWFTGDEAVAEKLVDAITDDTRFVTTTTTKPQPGQTVESIFGSFTAVGEEDDVNHLNNFDMTKQEKDALIAEHKLTGVTGDSSDTAIYAAISNTITALRTRVATFESAQGDQIQAQVDAFIAIKTKETGVVFTADENANLVNIAKTAGIESFKAALAMVKPAPLLSNMLAPGGAAQQPGANGVKAPEGRETWTIKDWAEKDGPGLEALSLSIKPEDVALFASMYKAEYGTVPLAQ